MRPAAYLDPTGPNAARPPPSALGSTLRVNRPTPADASAPDRGKRRRPCGPDGCGGAVGPDVPGHADRRGRRAGGGAWVGQGSDQTTVSTPRRTGRLLPPPTPVASSRSADRNAQILPTPTTRVGSLGFAPRGKGRAGCPRHPAEQVSDREEATWATAGDTGLVAAWDRPRRPSTLSPMGGSRGGLAAPERARRDGRSPRAPRPAPWSSAGARRPGAAYHRMRCSVPTGW